jgi:hypothetical protein
VQDLSSEADARTCISSLAASRQDQSAVDPHLGKGLTLPFSFL